MTTTSTISGPLSGDSLTNTLESPQEALTRLDAEIAALQAEYKPIAKTMLLGPSFGRVNVQQFIRKCELAIAIAGKEQERAAIRQQVAEVELDRLTNASPDFLALIEEAKAEVSRLEDALIVASRETNRLRSAEAERQNQSDELRKRIANAAYDAQRWADEEEKDRSRLAEARLREAMQADPGFGPV